MRYILCLFLLLPFNVHAKAKPKATKDAGANAAQILQKADAARGGLSSGLGWKIQLLNAGENQSSEFDVKVKDVNVLVKCTAPARQKGETYLFNDRNLWVHKPGLKKPVSISLRQRLSGQAANGDIATTNYSRDYTATIEGSEKVRGQMAYKLLLQAKEKNVTYDKIRYWVTKDKFLGIQAEFLTVAGQLFKKASMEYNNTVTVAGKKMQFVSKMDIEDAHMASQKTTITYTQPEVEPVADSMFNVNNLR